MGAGPGLFPIKVECSQKEYDNGEHYAVAESAAELKRYEGPFVVIDENDGPSWLFDHVVWANVGMVGCPD
jgi:hypothetical protein